MIALLIAVRADWALVELVKVVALKSCPVPAVYEIPLAAAPPLVVKVGAIPAAESVKVVNDPPVDETTRLEKPPAVCTVAETPVIFAELIVLAMLAMVEPDAMVSVLVAPAPTWIAKVPAAVVVVAVAIPEPVSMWAAVAVVIVPPTSPTLVDDNDLIFSVSMLEPRVEASPVKMAVEEANAETPLKVVVEPMLFTSAKID